MQYLTGRKIHLDVLADLLTTSVYPLLGRLLVDTFQTILFDEPTIKHTDLPDAERELLLQGRNPKFWQLQPRETFANGKEYDRHRKRLQRDEIRFKSILDKYRPGENWQGLIVDLIREKWEDLSTVTPTLSVAIDQQLKAWNCPNFTGVSAESTDRETPVICPNFTDPENGHLSQIYTLSIGENWDNGSSETVERGTPTNDEVSTPQNLVELSTEYHLKPLFEPDSNALRTCPVTGFDISHQPASTKFLSSTSIRAMYDNDLPMFQLLAARYLDRKHWEQVDPDRWSYYIAHSIRNTVTNPRNNLRKRVNRLEKEQGLFSPGDTVKLDAHRSKLLGHWKGTAYEVQIR